MSDPLQFYELMHLLQQRARENLAGLVKGAVLLVVAVAVGWQVIFSWVGDRLSGPEALTLLVALLLAVGAAGRWVNDLHGPQLALLLVLPVAIWAAVQIVTKVTAREAYRSDIQANMRRFRAALRRDPRNVAAHLLLGDAHLKLGRPGRAQAEYRAAVALDPRSYETRYKLERVGRLLRSP